LVFRTLIRNFAENKIYCPMTTAQLNADIQQSLGIIADDEGLMTRAARYLRRLAKELAHEPTEMTEEEFFARVDMAPTRKSPSPNARRIVY